ncbi:MULTISPECIES: DUF3095 domain-containing protein [unclassified Bradyrhizobium]|uniref:DUF3095 domain-containing protein n=1 Tax=unclassified Bradyrhizobium TaxID=2631580 RepID=UPI0024788B81|nr:MULTISPECIES: DUF3095 domain-containing protein [unclassified Bradyrhizobium]WGS19923.1 DUF3095 domain-containing protein [Bradyrhizobium sp. ISRA463]WGS26777.1 DUF3095 domain-containing protein [Bradyrhizobium sp. ISRA464]
MTADGSEPAFEVGLFRVKIDQEAKGDRFYEALVPFDSFDDVVRRDRYRPLPNDWIIAVTDVSQSTEAIEQGRYREVNTAGAAVLAAVSNALPDLQFPSTFGGDGASFAAPGAHSSIIKDTLARTAAWAEDALGLTLRIAVIPIADIRAQQLDVLVARFAPSSNVTYAMFAGGGLAWAERELKQGGYTVPRAPIGVTADLTGLSCRFAPISTKRGVILSLIVVPRHDPTSFVELIQELLRTLRSDEPGLHPLPAEGPQPAWTGDRLDHAIKKGSRKMPFAAWAAKCLRAVPARVGTLLGIPVGGFHEAKFRQELVENTDYRKFDDGLRMTVDCSSELADVVDARLEEAQRRGACFFGTHRQLAANLTCFVPSPTRANHVHFVDGASGGYAFAAANLKRNVASGVGKQGVL